VIVSSGDWTAPDLNKARLCDLAFNHLGFFGDLILVGGLLTFVFSTILGWGYYGEKAIEYLFGVGSVFLYRMLWIVAVFFGAVWKSDTVWNFCDIMNGLMALPNLAALLLLSGVIASETRRYFSKSS
jgi:AGCS family alanine or glycine:cation symporter